MIAGRCKHYRSDIFISVKCKKGKIPMVFAGPPLRGWLKRTPCFKSHIRTGKECSDYEPCDSNMNEIQQKRHLLINNYIMPLIHNIKEKYPEGVSKKIIDCPLCKGRLRFSVVVRENFYAPLHTYGACQNKLCLNWME